MVLTINQHTERLTLAITKLGKSKLFLGHEWLRLHNPSIDWAKQTLAFDRCPSECGYSTRFTSCLDEDDDESTNDPESKLEEGEHLFLLDWQAYLCLDRVDIRARGTTSTHLAEAEAKKQTPKSFEEVVPAAYHNFRDVFVKESFDELPER